MNLGIELDDFFEGYEIWNRLEIRFKKGRYMIDNNERQKLSRIFNRYESITENDSSKLIQFFSDYKKMEEMAKKKGINLKEFIITRYHI